MPKPLAGAARGQLPPASSGRSARVLRTLKGQFIVAAALILLLAAILTLIGATTLSRATDDLTTINSGSIPSVDAAQAITQLIEDIDAQSADFLATAGLRNTEACTLVGSSTTLQLSVHDCDERNIDAETVLVNQQLFQAAHNVTYPGEQTAVERITIGLESYLADIRLMRTDYGLAQGKTDVGDPHLQQAYQAYLAASAILHNQVNLPTINSNQIPFDRESNLPGCTINGQLLPPDQWAQGSLTRALDCLSNINYSHLKSAYDDSSSFLSSETALIIALGLLLCGLLLVSTGRMMQKTHRLLNPGLLTATLIAVIFSFSAVGFLSSLQGQGSQPGQDGAFRQMVLDDYDSVYYAALLKRYGTDANADESRWLIAQEFNDAANIRHWQQDWNNNVSQIIALMKNAHANRTWNEEDAPLQDMDTFWQQYSTIDGQMRSTANNLSISTHILEAERLSTGQSNIAFGNFTDAVDRLSQANRDHYTATLGATQGTLILYFVLCLVLLPLSGLLATSGITIRLKDF